MRIGELFSGYGGLGQGVQAAIGGDVVWHSEFDRDASAILAYRYPDIPNHGDITLIDWATVEPVDVLTGGSPCQDLSHAGKRGGMSEGTRSNLWVSMREAIAQLRPQMVVWENVRGAYSAAADSDVEPCPGCVGDEPGVSLRALARVLGDLADLGYDAGWHGLRAADVGAPHGRFRVFVVARDATHGAVEGRVDGDDTRPGETQRVQGPARGGHLAAADTDVVRHERGRPTRGRRPGPADGGVADADAVGSGLVGWAPDAGRGPLRRVATSGGGEGAVAAPDASGERHGRREDTRSLGRVDREDEAGARQRQRARAESEHRGAETAPDAFRGGRAGWAPEPQRGPLGGTAAAGSGRTTCDFFDWGQYAPAIYRWEQITGRPACAPTEHGRTGPRLSPRFVEWLMGLPDGWVTDVPGISRNAQLKALGNGVVPQQAEAAVRHLLTVTQVAA